MRMDPSLSSIRPEARIPVLMRWIFSLSDSSNWHIIGTRNPDYRRQPLSGTGQWTAFTVSFEDWLAWSKTPRGYLKRIAGLIISRHLNSWHLEWKLTRNLCKVGFLCSLLFWRKQYPENFKSLSRLTTSEIKEHIHTMAIVERPIINPREYQKVQ